MAVQSKEKAPAGATLLWQCGVKIPEGVKEEIAAASERGTGLLQNGGEE